MKMNFEKHFILLHGLISHSNLDVVISYFLLNSYRRSSNLERKIDTTMVNPFYNFTIFIVWRFVALMYKTSAMPISADLILINITKLNTYKN